MASGQDDGVGYWGYLIKPDKTATPTFEQLCRGLARIIRTLEPGSDQELTPAKLATFYRAVGGNLDSIFLKMSDSGLSFLYRTLGCFHSLEPTENPFETPCRPCLTETGFVRWQTLQLLLCPAEHVPYMQRAVQLWDVPRADGGTFPKRIPRECFPDRPDNEMEQWHRFVTSRMNQDNYIRRLKNSPYQSPYSEAHDSPAGYFGKIPAIKRPSSGRRNSGEEEQARLLAYRRRSSVPDLPSPGGLGGHLYDKDGKRKSRSPSAQRNTSGSRPRSSTANASSKLSPTVHRSSQSMSNPRHGSNTSIEKTNRPTSSRNRNRSQPSSNDTSAEDASSEESNQDRRHQSGGDDGHRHRLWVPSFLSPHKRRHSSGPELRKRDDRSPRRESAQRQPQPSTQSKPQQMEPQQRPQPTVRFKNNLFNNQPESPVLSSDMAPLSPAVTSPPSSYRYSMVDPSNLPSNNRIDGIPPEPYIPHTLSDLGIEHDQWARKAGRPLRVNTVSGVNGRKYASAEPSKNGGPGSSRDSRGSRARNAVPSLV